MAVSYYRILLASDGDAGWSAEFPDLPGCATCGDDLNDALHMSVEAAPAWIEAATAGGHKVPDPLPLYAPLPAWMDQDTEVDWRGHQRVLVPVDRPNDPVPLRPPSCAGNDIADHALIS